MFEFITNPEERGQVGIGTLIVFIAMVLVAAIAAGVLINTAGFLQTQAEATGEDSTDLVSERIAVTSEVGVVGDSSAGELSEIRLSVTGAPGADQIDLAETTIQAVGPGGQENLVFTDTTGESIFLSTDALTANDDGTVVIDSVTASAFVSAYDEIGATSDSVDVTLDINGETATKTSSIDSLQSTTFDIGSDGSLSTGATGSDGTDAGLGDGDTVTLEITPTGESNTLTSKTADAASSSAPAIEVGDELVSDLDANEFAVGSDGSFVSSPVLSDQDDYTILINPGAGAFNSGTFGEGNEATVDIVSPAGATTQVELRAPDLFSEDGEAVQL